MFFAQPNFRDGLEDVFLSLLGRLLFVWLFLRKLFCFCFFCVVLRGLPGLPRQARLHKASLPSSPCAMAVPPPYLWGASRKDQNRLAHITYGNGARADGAEDEPQVSRVGTVNISSLHRQGHCLADAQCDILLTQETRITSENQGAMRQIMRQYGWEVLWGHGVSSAHVGGVAVLFKPGHSASQIAPATRKGRSAYAEDRLMIAAIAFNRGKSVLYVINVYGHSGAGREEEREKLISTALCEAAALGDVAIAIGGDWNTEPQDSAVIGRALGSNLWHDVGSAAGVGDTPTFVAPQGSSRIDYWLVNSRAAPMVGGVSVVQETAIPGHRPVVMQLTTSRAKQNVTQNVRTVRQQTQGPAPKSQMVEDYAATVQLAHSSEWRSCVLEQDVEKMWTLWCRIAEKISNFARCMRSKAGSLPLGSAPLFVTGPPRKSKLPKEDLGTMRARKMGHAVRRAEELQRNGDNPERASRSATSWQLIFRASRTVFAGCVPLDLFPNEMPARDTRQSALEAMREALRNTLDTIKSERIANWKSRMTMSSKGSGKLAYKWMRGDATTQCGLLERGDGKLTGCPEEIMEILSDKWMPVFRRYSTQTEPDPSIFLAEYENEVAKLATGVEPPRLQALDAAELKVILSRMKTDTAPGLDGWTVADLKSLPNSCLNSLATFLQAVENTGVWPKALSVAKVTLIPKANGSTDPGAQRPITVMSVVYRLWASTRLHQCEEWQAEYLPWHMHGFCKGRSVEDGICINANRRGERGRNATVWL